MKVDNIPAPVPQGYVGVRVDKVLIASTPLPYHNSLTKPTHTELGHTLGHVTVWPKKYTAENEKSLNGLWYPNYFRLGLLHSNRSSKRSKLHPIFAFRPWLPTSLLPPVSAKDLPFPRWTFLFHLSTQPESSLPASPFFLGILFMSVLQQSVSVEVAWMWFYLLLQKSCLVAKRSSTRMCAWKLQEDANHIEL